MGGWRIRVALALGLGVMAWPGQALGQASLEWSAPPGCPPAEQVEKSVERLLGHSLAEDDTMAQFHAQVTRQEEGAWLLVLGVARGDDISDRRIEGESCQAVADAAAVAIALALRPPRDGPDEIETEPRDQPENLGQAPAEPSHEPVEEEERRDTSPEPATPRSDDTLLGFAARLTGGLDTSAFPGVAMQTNLAAALLVGASFRAELYGLLLPAQEFSVGGSAKTDFQLFGGGTRACLQPVQGNIGLVLCEGLEAGQIRASGKDLRRAQEGKVYWVAPTTTLLGLWAMTETLALAASAEAAIPLLRHEFFIDGIGTVHEIPGVTVRLGLGLELGWQ